MKEEPKKDSDNFVPDRQRLSSADVWAMIERNLGYKLVPLKLDELGQISIDKSGQNNEKK